METHVHVHSQHAHSLSGNEDLLLAILFLLCPLDSFMMGLALVNLFVQLLAVLCLFGLFRGSHWSLLKHIRRLELITAGNLLAVLHTSHAKIEGCHFLTLLSVLHVLHLKEMDKVCVAELQS